MVRPARTTSAVVSRAADGTAPELPKQAKERLAARGRGPGLERREGRRWELARPRREVKTGRLGPMARLCPGPPSGPPPAKQDRDPHGRHDDRRDADDLRNPE